MSQQLSHLCTKFAFSKISTIEFTSKSIWCQRWDPPHVCCHRWSDNRSPENRFHPAIYFCWIFQLNMIALYWTLLMCPFSNRFADIFPGLGSSNNFCRHPPHICHLWYATTALPRDKTALAHLAFWFVYLVRFSWFTWRSVWCMWCLWHLLLFQMVFSKLSQMVPKRCPCSSQVVPSGFIYVTMWPKDIAWLSLNFILDASWVALYSVVCEWCKASVTPDQISTFFQYIQAYKPYADPVPCNTKQCQFLLTQYHQVPDSIALYWPSTCWYHL